MYPNINLQPGQTGAGVQQLQQFLLSQGYLTQQQINTGPGIYGPQTTAAVRKWQQANGVDNTSGPGYWGPRSIAAAGGGGRENQQRGGSLRDQVTEVMRQDPFFTDYLKHNSPEDIEYASASGDFSALRNEYGQPFSRSEQQKALKQAGKMDEDYYKALKQKETADVENALAQKQANYQDYLLNSGQQFEEDKTGLDQSAADKGVLFSGGRVQKEKNLERAYQQDQASKLGSMTRDIGATARDYQYQYGNKAAKKLNQQYNLGGNTYNANVARGGVGSSGLSSVYNTKQFDFKGTRVGEQAAQANRGATQLLKNRANKLMASGYSNQY